MRAHPETEAAFRAALRGGPVPAGVVARGDVARRMDVYRNNVAHSLHAALAARFPVIRRLVGEAFFGALAKVYVDADPPRSPVLADWGDGFAGFLDGFPPLSAYPYMGAVARVEYARGRAFHAADAPPLNPARLAGADADTLRLGLHPSVTVLRLDHPGATIWARNQPGAAQDRTGIPPGAETRARPDAAVSRQPKASVTGHDTTRAADARQDRPGGAAGTAPHRSKAMGAARADDRPNTEATPARAIRPGPEIALILRDRDFGVPVAVIGAGDAALVEALRAGRLLGAAAMDARRTDPDHDPQPLLLRLMAAGAITEPED